MKMEQSECSETTAHKIQTPGNHPKERIQSKITLLLTKDPSMHFLSLTYTYLLFHLILCISFTIFYGQHHELCTNWQQTRKCVISCFRRGVNENNSSSGTLRNIDWYLPVFRGKLSVPFLRVKLDR